MRLKKFLAVILLFNIIFTMSCSKLKKEEKNSEKKKINVYMDVKDKYTQDIIKYLIEGYKKEKSEFDIQTNSPLESSKLKEDVVKGGIDLLFTSRNKMLELYRNGVLSEMSEIYTKNKINDRYYNIVTAYGRIGDKYYGMGLMPYTIEAFYNTNSLNKLGLSEPKNPEEISGVLKKLNENKIEVPVILNEEIDIKSAVTSLLFNNILDPQKVENTFDSGKDKYSSLEVQGVFNGLNNLVQKGYFNEDSFEVGNESSITRLKTGDIPVVIGISYINKDLKESSNVNVMDVYEVSNIKTGTPVIVNCLVSIPANTKNEEAVDDFLEYVFSDKTQKQLAAKGFITGDKSANKEVKAKPIGSRICKHLENGDNNIFYQGNFPTKFLSYLDAAVSNILDKKYTGREWENIVNNIYNTPSKK